MSIIAMNLHTNKEVGIKLEKSLQELGVEEYLFTPDGDITSRFALNRISKLVITIGCWISFINSDWFDLDDCKRLCSLWKENVKVCNRYLNRR